MAGRQNWRKGMNRPLGSGRPRLFEERGAVTIAVEAETKAVWLAFAVNAGLTVGEVVRRAMTAYIKETMTVIKKETT